MKKEKKIKNKENKARRFPKFYILDAAIIILILSAVLGIYFRYNVFDMLGNYKDQDSAQIVFSVKNIKETTKSFINIDDEVYFKDNGSKFGTIIQGEENSNEALVGIVPATANFVDNGNLITVSDPSGTRIDANGRIKCQGLFSNDGSFKLNGTEYLSVGQTKVICTELVTIEITILKIEKIQQ